MRIERNRTKLSVESAVAGIGKMTYLDFIVEFVKVRLTYIELVLKTRIIEQIQVIKEE